MGLVPRGRTMHKFAPVMLMGSHGVDIRGSRRGPIEGIKGGEKVEDFFHYRLESVPIKHDQPVKIPFIKQALNVRYEDIYLIDLDKKVRVVSSEEDEESSVKVIHGITFRNPTVQPLTSGPVSVLAKAQQQNTFMVQSMMKHTNPYKKVTVELTQTFDILANYIIKTGKDKRTELWSRAVKDDGEGRRYVDIIKKEGKMVIQNKKKSAIKCKIEYLLQGHFIKSTPILKKMVERPSGNHRELNPSRKMTWEMTVPANGKAELNIHYEVKVFQDGKALFRG